MRLNRLTLHNFKGVADFTLEPDGDSISVFGANNAGKSSLFDAFCFVAAGRDSHGSADFEIKTLDASGEPLHNLEHSVEVVLDDRTLTRTYKEVWTQKRGSVAKEFSGHTTDYMVDGVPTDKRDYDATVAGLCGGDIETLRLVTDPAYFASLPQVRDASKKSKSRREMLMGAFASDVTDAMVIDGSPSLASLTEAIGRHTVDESREVAKARCTKINGLLKTVPAGIAELDRSLKAMAPEPAGVDAALVAAKLELSKLQEKRAELVAGGDSAELTKQIAQAELLIDRWERARQREWNEGNAGAQQARQELAARLGTARQDATNLARSIDGDESDLARKRIRLEQLRGEKHALEADVFTGAEDCQTCGQPLPADRVESAKERFNLALADRKKANQAVGTPLWNEIKALVVSITEQEAALVKLQTNLVAAQREYDASGEVSAFVLDKSAPDYGALVAKRDGLLAKQREGTTDSAGTCLVIDGKIGRISQVIADCERHIAARSVRQQTESRIEELKGDIQRLTVEYEELAFHLGQLEKFVRAKCSMVEKRINEKFALARFKLFDTQINEGVRECCEITYMGVPWGSLNTGARINVGLDIIESFTKAMGLDPMPIFIDNSESVTDIRETAGQQIRLVVRRGFPLTAVKDGAELEAFYAAEGERLRPQRAEYEASLTGASELGDPFLPDDLEQDGIREMEEGIARTEAEFSGDIDYSD